MIKKQQIDLFSEIFEACSVLHNETINKHIRHLKAMDQYLPPMDSFFLLTDVKKQTYEFVSKNFEYTLGYPVELMLKGGMKFAFSTFHPKDLPFFVAAVKDMFEYMMMNFPAEQRSRVIFTWNTRAKNTQGKYLNILAQEAPVSFDEQGSPLLFLGHNTVVGEGEERPVIGTMKILNEQDEYETVYYRNYSQPQLSEAPLSRREQDVLRLLVLNKTSREIAKAFFISHHTVDTHRRNILKKLNCRSSRELARYLFYLPPPILPPAPTI